MSDGVPSGATDDQVVFPQRQNYVHLAIVWDGFAIGHFGPQGRYGLVRSCVEESDGAQGVGLVFVRGRVLTRWNSFHQTCFAEAQEGEARATLALGRRAGGVEFFCCFLPALLGSDGLAVGLHASRKQRSLSVFVCHADSWLPSGIFQNFEWILARLGWSGRWFRGTGGDGWIGALP